MKWHDGVEEGGDERSVTGPTALLGSGGELPPPGDVEAGTTLCGRYRIEKLLGQGGSGRVFAAHDDVLKERVALKLLRPERAQERSWIRRLAREVKVARLIRHPNICRVFELGHDAGNWFVTMELAEGGTLKDLLQQRSAAGGHSRRASPDPLWPQRIAEARAVCAGLAALHAVGIVHRDVTPQNILRMRDSRLALSDFGLAVAAQETTTFFGGTPHYMAPEVVAGRRADQRSDVYQLGLVLHEILFGRRVEWSASSRRPAPRSPLSDARTPAEEELFALCADCLAQDPAARPPSAIQVAGRLAAAEAARPRAWPARAWRRLRSLTRRPWVRSGAAAFLLVVTSVEAARLAARPTICAGGATKIGMVWELQSAQRAEGSRHAAIRRAFLATGKSYAEQTLSAVLRMLDNYATQWAVQYKDTCEATHVHGEQSEEVLDLRMGCLNERLAGLRAVVDIFVNATGVTVERAVDATRALAPLSGCDDIQQLRAVIPPPDPLIRLRVAQLRLELARIKALHDAGRYGAALSGLTPISIEAESLGYEPLKAEVAARKGWEEIELLHYKQGEATLEQALTLALASRHDALVAETASNLVWVAGNQGRFEDSERWARLAEAAVARTAKSNSVLHSWLLNNSACLFQLQGRLRESLEYNRRALDLKKAALPADHIDIAISLANIALVLNDLGRSAEALHANDEALTIMRSGLGLTHPRVGVQLINRGEILASLGRGADALTAFDESRGILGRDFGVDQPLMGHALTGEGATLLQMGRAKEAIPLLERALTIRETQDPYAGRLSQTMFTLARALWNSGESRSRSVTLARDAYERFPRIPMFEGKRSEIARWLSKRDSRHPQRGRN